MDGESGSRVPADGFKCPVCSRVISSRASLLRHVQTIHETRQIFPCRLCHLSFKRKYDLARHCRIHDAVRHFLCDTCGKGFSRKDNLNLHRRQKHNIDTRTSDQGQTCARDPVLFDGYQDSFQKAYEKSNKHFVGGQGPTPQHPDPVPYKPPVTSSQQDPAVNIPHTRPPSDQPLGLSTHTRPPSDQPLGLSTHTRPPSDQPLGLSTHGLPKETLPTGATIQKDIMKNNNACILAYREQGLGVGPCPPTKC